MSPLHARIATLVLATWSALVAVDLLVEMRFVQQLAEGDWFVGWPSLAGLALADLQVALLCAPAAIVGARLARVVAPCRSPALAELAAAGAGLAALGVIIQSGFVRGAAVGVVAWPVLHLAYARVAARTRAGASSAVAAVTLPMLVVALASDALASSSPALGAAATLVLASGALAIARPRAWMRPFAWTPASAALVLAVLLATGALARGSAHPLAPEVAPTGGARPNVVLVVLDTVRADHLRRHGYHLDTMPALERFADGALVVEHAISTAGWTPPSHASMFSGRTVSGHGLHYAFDDRTGLLTRPFEGTEWLPERLARLGYRTHAVTANELAIPEGAAFHRAVAPRFVDWTRSTGGFVDAQLPWSLPGDEALRWRMLYTEGDCIVDLVRETTPADDGRPLFLFVNLLDAHAPYLPPTAALDALGLEAAPLVDRYASTWELRQAWDALPADKVERVRALYDGGLRALDEHVERLLGWIDARLGDDALVVVTSDHGELLGEGNEIGHDVGLARELIHVPLLVRGPGFEPGLLEGTLSVRHVFEIVERAARGETVDLAALRAADELGCVSERYPRGYHGERGRAWVSLVDEGCQAIGPRADGAEALTFPAGTRDVDPTLAARLGDRIEAYWQEHRDRRDDDTASGAKDADQRERLRAIGYGR